jgi:hypothetical protein
MSLRHIPFQGLTAYGVLSKLKENDPCFLFHLKQACRVLSMLFGNYGLKVETDEQDVVF